MVHDVHDALFKSTFSQVEHAAGELRVVLPPALAARIDFTSLALCPGSFVDEALAQRHTDLLFSAKLAGRTALLYVLFEHKSGPDELTAFQLLRYMVRIWEDFLKNQPDAKRLPPIVPVVVHHGAAGWTVLLAADRFGPEDLVARLSAAMEENDKEELVTAGEILIERGREEGRKEGMREGQRKMLLTQLRARFGALPEVAIARVNAASAAELDLWAERVLTAPSLEDVLGSA